MCQALFREYGGEGKRQSPCPHGARDIQRANLEHIGDDKSIGEGKKLRKTPLIRRALIRNLKEVTSELCAQLDEVQTDLGGGDRSCKTNARTL